MTKFVELKIEKKQKPDPREVVEDVYEIIKVLAIEKYIKSDNLTDIADLITELANRLKVEEADGESQG